MNSNRLVWRWFFVLAALEAGAAFVALAVVPHDPNGLSLSRLVMLLALGIFAGVAAVLAVRRPAAVEQLARPRNTFAAFVVAVALATALFLLRYLAPERLLPYYARLSPLLWYLLAAALDFAILCLVVSFGVSAASIRDRRATWRAAGLALAVLLVAMAFVILTRIGITPDAAYWGEPAPPVLAWQLALALLCAVGLLLVEIRWKRAPGTGRVLAVVLWALAVLVWLSVPTRVMKNSFYAPMNPPANQPFPNSDAGYYDSMAQSLLIGYPYQGDIPTRPLYITFLALLHVVGGQNYALIIAGQTMLLALIPVFLFLLGSRLHSRLAGLVCALFAIFREWNSLLISSQTRVSNTKTLLSDLPTLLLMLVACWFVLRWLQRRGWRDALLAGGFFGILLLLRTQSLVLLPLVIALAIVVHGIRTRRWVVPVVLFAAGAAAVLAPWLLHNYLQSGQLTMEAPFENQVIASQYKYTGNLDLGAVDLQGKSLFGTLLAFALKDPGFVAGFIASHTSATLIDGMLALPLAEAYAGLQAPLNLYWMYGAVNVSGLNLALLVAYLAVIAVGLGASWKRFRWVGLTPLVFGVGYALANGIARFSGWRYDLPADWIAYFYFAVGAAELIRTGAMLFGAPDDSQSPTINANSDEQIKGSTAVLLIGAFVLTGSLPWLAEGLSSPRYAADTLPGLSTQLADSAAVQALQVDSLQIEKFAASPQATLQIGRVLYPRFFIRSDGLSSSHPWPAYAVRDFPRMGFLLLNQTRHDAVMPLKQGSVDFPQGADAIVLGCDRQGYIEVRLIYFPQTDAAYQSGPLSAGCEAQPSP